MDPITMMMGATDLIGLGMKLFGGFGASQKQSQMASLSSSNAQLEMQMNDQRKRMMELTAKRQQIENSRRVNQAHSMALTAASNQGAQFGSGLRGGLGGISAMGAYNASNISQNLQVGENIFGLEHQIGLNKIQIANLGGSAATDEGIAGLGGDLMKAADPLGKLLKGFNFGG